MGWQILAVRTYSLLMMYLHDEALALGYLFYARF